MGRSRLMVRSPDFQSGRCRFESDLRFQSVRLSSNRKDTGFLIRPVRVRVLPGVPERER